MPRRPLAPTLILVLALPGAALGRDLSGEVTIRERIALPPGSEAVVEVMAPEGRLPELVLPLAGQPPAAFALAVPEAPLVLRAAIRAPGGRIWAIDPLRVAAGAEAVTVGTLVAVAAREGGFASTLACGGAVLRLGFAEGGARLSRGGVARDLAPVPAASGARYEAGDTSVHTRGAEATVVWEGEALPPCRPFPWPEAGEVVARGNEPGWVMRAGPEGVRLSMQDGTDLQALAQATLAGDDAVRVVAPGLPDLVLTPGPCADTMTGMPYPAHAVLGEGEEAMTGCAGDPADLLAGEWQVTAVGGAALPEGAGITLGVAEGRVAGRSGCNRYTAALELTGEGLRIGPAAGTMMACPPEAMERERAFLDALGRVDRFGIAEDGALLLFAADIEVLRATR